MLADHEISTIVRKAGAGMRTSAKVADQRNDRITFDDRTMSVALMDGRVIRLPLEWYPRLLHATPVQRWNYRIETPGDCVHWPDVDEDLHVDGMLKGVPAPGYRRRRRC